MKRKTTLLLVLTSVAALTLSAVVPATGKVKPPPDKGGAPGTISFVDAPYTVGEGAGHVTVTVERLMSGGQATGKGPAAVDVTTSDGTASSSSDYTAVSTTLTFAKGETQASVNIPILDDYTVEDGETFTITLSNPTGRYGVPDPISTVTITDDDTEAGPIANGGFETGDFTGWTAGASSFSDEPNALDTFGSGLDVLEGTRSTHATATASITPQQLEVTPPTPVVQDTTVHSGTYAAYLGGPVEDVTPTGMSYVDQDVTVPTDGQNVLRLYYLLHSASGGLGLEICDAALPAGEINNCSMGMDLSNSSEVWQERQISLADYVGQTVRIVFYASQWGGEYGASMYVDDVSLLMAGPEYLYAEAVTPGETPPYEIDLTWDPAADATDGYSVWRSTFSGGSYTQIGTTTATSYQDTTVDPATYYCYVVRAITANGETGNSDESCAEVVAEQVFNGGFETGDLTGWTAETETFFGPSAVSTAETAVVPPIPVVQETTVHSGSYAASLGGSVDGVTPTGSSYLYTDVLVPTEGGTVGFFYRPQTATGEAIQVALCYPSPPSVDDVGCYMSWRLPYGDVDSWHQGLLDLDGTELGGQTIRIVFSVYQSDGISAQLYLDDVTLEAPMTSTTPATPTGLTANADGAFQISLSWDAADGATGYEVLRSTNPLDGYTTIGETDVTSFQDDGLVPETTYYYLVRSMGGFINDVVWSEYSNGADATTGTAVATMLDTLEADTSGWTTTGMVGDQSQSLWHLIDDSTCVTPAYTSATHAFYYGIDSTCNYQTVLEVDDSQVPVKNSGTLTSPVYTIPETAEVVSFAYLLQTECSGSVCGYDQATVEVSYDSGATWVPTGGVLPPSGGDWTRAYLPIAPSGTSLQVRFVFDTKDDYGNFYLGWMIDDLSVYTSAAGPLLVNGDFETSGTFGDTGFGWSVRRPLPGLEPVPAIVTSALGGNSPHGGTYVVHLGGSYPDYSGARDSQIQQTVAVPDTGTTTLTWWYQMSCSTSAGNDWATALIYSVPEGLTPLAEVWHACEGWTSTWTQRSVDLSAYHGQTIKVVFGLRQADFNFSTVWIDDVAVTNVPAP